MGAGCSLMARVVRWIALALGTLLLAGALTLVVALRMQRAEASPVDRVTPAILHVRNFLADIYAARVGEHVILFDAGMDPDGYAIDQLLSALGADRNLVSDVFLTHGHFDHVAAADLFLNAEVHIGSGDAEMLAQRVPTQPVVPRFFGAILGTTELEAGNRLEAQTTIDVGAAESVLALPFPGHTPGSFLFLFDGVLFTGDSILMDHGKLTPANPHHSVDLAENQRSIAALDDVLREHPVNVVCTGHMGCTRAEETRALLDALIASVQ